MKARLTTTHEVTIFGEVAIEKVKELGLLDDLVEKAVQECEATGYQEARWYLHDYVIEGEKTGYYWLTEHRQDVVILTVDTFVTLVEMEVKC